MKLTRALTYSLVILIVSPSLVFAQVRMNPADLSPVGTLQVRVRSGGAPLPISAFVRLFSETRAIEYTASTKDMGMATFNAVPLGNYRMEISAPGYQLHSEEVSVMFEGSSATLIIELRPESAAGAVAPSGPPILTPKATKELNQAVEAMRVSNFARALEHLQKVIKMAPGHPDAYYLLGLIHLQQKNLSAARAQLEKAIRLYPDHAQALISLGGLHYQEGRMSDAATSLERALQLNPAAWQAHETLAAAHLEQKNFAKARLHAERALELSRGKTFDMHFVLGVSLWELGEKARATEELKLFVEKRPEHPGAARANEILKAVDTPAAVGTPDTISVQDTPATAPLSAAQPASKPIAAAEPILPVPKRWPLPPVDESMPEIRAGVTCSLPLVLTGVSKHVQSLVKNLEQITATESIEAVESDALGNRRLTDPRRYYYVVAISEVRAGTLTVDEYRKPVSAQQPPPRGIETHGLFALPLLFHPFYSKDFEFRCEGLTQWHGQPAWSVYFQQRKDRPSRIRAYSLRNGRFPVKLKGRVWIAQNSYEILRLEANMLEPVKEIQLQHEHLVIEYQPMEFATRKDKLWLPTTAEYFAHFRDRVYHFRHSLSDYLVFNVNFGEKQKAPKPIEVPPENPPDKPLR